jgi:hypothetical protein
MAYNRYSDFEVNGVIKLPPFIKLPSKSSDKEDTYIRGTTRFDILSNKYYKDSNYGWLILLANPSLGSLEFNILDNSTIVIPFPLETSLNDYSSEVEKYIKYYGV